MESIVTDATRSSTDADKPARRSGQSRSPNIVPCHMLVIVSSCAIIVTVFLSGAVFTIFDFKKCHDIEIRVKGH